MNKTAEHSIGLCNALFMMLLSSGLYNHVILTPILLKASGRDAWIGVLIASLILSLIDHTPQGITKQFNRIPPLMALDFIREYRDKARTVVLPNLSLGQSWYSGGKPNPLPFIDGAFLFQDKK